MGAVITLAEATLPLPADPEAVWAVWRELALRPDWHPRLEWARLDGALAVGARGAWKPAGARPVRVQVAAVDPGRRLVLVGTHGPPVARGHYEHAVMPTEHGGSAVTHRMWLSGPLAVPIRALFGRALSGFATEEALLALGECVARRAESAGSAGNAR